MRRLHYLTLYSAKEKIMKKIVFALLLLGVMAVPAFSQMMDMSMMEHRGEHGQMMGMCAVDKMNDMIGMCLKYAGKVGLSDDQLAKMKPLHNEMQKKQARFVADLKIAEIELMEIMEVKDFDMGEATAAVDKIAEIKKTHHLEMLTAMKEIRAVLTDEQFKEMKKMMMSEMGEGKATKSPVEKRH